MNKLLLTVLFIICVFTHSSLGGSGSDPWGVNTLINYPPGKSRGTVPNQANDEGDPAPIDVPCQCSDADPRNEATQNVDTTCFYHRIYNNCKEDFMFDANAELAPEGFCQISCSRCNCCQSVVDVIRSLGTGSSFLQAAQTGLPSLMDILTHPGFVGTVLVPTDEAFAAFASQHGSLLQNPQVVQEILKLHVIQPEKKRNALWTSPFMSLGVTMDTLYDGPNNVLKTSKFSLPSDVTYKGGLEGFAISGPFNEAHVVKSDIPACKAYVTTIDTVLVPFDPSRAPNNDFMALSHIVGADGCIVQQNAIISGSVVKSGDSNIQSSVGECCASCKSTSGCNAWTYCPQKRGCAIPNGATRGFGWCELKRSDELSSGQNARYDDFSTVTVPSLVSGFLFV